MRRSKRKTAFKPSTSNSSSPATYSNKPNSKTGKINSSGNNVGHPANVSKQKKAKASVKSPNPKFPKSVQVLNPGDLDIQEEFPETNPLLTHVVFSKILNFNLSLHDIKQLRLVCKTWYQYTLNKFRSNVAIRLGPTGTNFSEEPEWSDILSRVWNFEDYFNCYKDPNDFQELATYSYTKYSLQGVYFGSNEIFFAGTGKFWDVVGPNIRHLRFKGCTFPAEKREFDLDHIFTENLLNLEILDFSECQMLPHVETEKLFDNWEINQTIIQASPRKNVNLKKLAVVMCLPMDLSVLLINSPNIESIDLDCQCTNEQRLYQQIADICSARRMFENQSYPLKEIKLNLKTASAGDTADLWTSMNLPLEHLSYSAMPLEHRTTGLSAVSSITASCANTLKTLEVFHPPVRDCIALRNLPTTLNSLEEIYCYGNVFGNFNFLKNNSPNLKVLYFDFKLYNDLDKIYKLTEGSDYLRQLENAYFPQGHRQLVWMFAAHEQRPMQDLVRFHIDINFYSESWKELAPWMPNLKILEAPLRSQAFRTVCRYFTGLEELVVLYESHVGDSEITGFEDDNASGNRNPYNLTNILGLKKFVLKKICGNPYIPNPPEVPAEMAFDEAEGLGDRSVFRGLLEMPNLEEVQFHASPNLTDNAVAALRQHLGKVEVIRSYGDMPHGNGECCKVEAFLQSVDIARREATGEINAFIFG